MPTALPTRPVPERRLSWLQVGRPMILVARVRYLDLWALEPEDDPGGRRPPADCIGRAP